MKLYGMIKVYSSGSTEIMHYALYLTRFTYDIMPGKKKNKTKQNKQTKNKKKKSKNNNKKQNKNKQKQTKTNKNKTNKNKNKQKQKTNKQTNKQKHISVGKSRWMIIEMYGGGWNL